jgi:hypothetical protein
MTNPLNSDYDLKVGLDVPVGWQFVLRMKNYGVWYLVLEETNYDPPKYYEELVLENALKENYRREICRVASVLKSRRKADMQYKTFEEHTIMAGKEFRVV